MSTNLFSPADREVIAAHIGEMPLTDAVLQRFFDSAIEQAIDKHEKALDAYRRALTMEREEGEPEPIPPVVPTPEQAVSDMMVNLRAALDVHTGDDGRARAFEDEMAKAIADAELINAAVDILDARYRKAAPAPAPHNFPANMSDRLTDWAEPGDLTTDDLTEDVIQKLTQAKRKKWTELLNVELAELQQERGGPREDLKREGVIEATLGLFSRVGEM